MNIYESQDIYIYIYGTEDNQGKLVKASNL